ncbi:MAG: hypothetical protein Q7S90_06875 [Rubrivivax sp.]|nr:hypothetical protein [Rubrivivax sp.]
MSTLRRLAKISALVVLGLAATGCIVLPFGAGHARYGRGDRHYSAPVEGPPVVIVAPRERHGRGGR